MWARTPEQALLYRRLRELVVLFALLVGPGLAAPASLGEIGASIRPLLAIITRNAAFVMLMIYLADLQGETVRLRASTADDSTQKTETQQAGSQQMSARRRGTRRIGTTLMVIVALGGVAALIGLADTLIAGSDAAIETSGTGQIVPQLIARYPFAVWIPLLAVAMISVGYVEELFFRDYLIRRFEQFGLSERTGVITAALLFSVGHGYQGIAATIFALVAGIVLGVLWLRRPDIHAFAVGHALYNLTAIAISAA